MNLKNSKKVYDVAEEIANNDFEKEMEPHTFSANYNQKKQEFMTEIKMEESREQNKMKLSKKKLIAATACLLIGLPTTAFAAVKVYDLVTEKQNHEVSVSVNNQAKNQAKKETKVQKNKWYQLTIPDLPEGMTAIDDSKLKYSFADNYAKGGFSFTLWQVEQKADFSTLYANNYEEKEINGRKAVIVKKDFGTDEEPDFNRQVFVWFKDEGIMLESFIGKDVSDQQMEQTFASISLTPTTKELESAVGSYDEIFKDREEGASYLGEIIPLKKDSSQLFNIQQKTYIEDQIEFSVDKLELFDSIADFQVDNFSESTLERLKENNILNQDNQLQTYERKTYKLGDGKNTLNELIGSKNVKVKFVYLTTTLKNTNTKATEEIYMHPGLEYLKEKGATFEYADEPETEVRSLVAGEGGYLAPHGVGKSYYNIGSLQPGESKIVNIGYFVDEDRLGQMFLNAPNYGGSLDMNDSRYYNWIDLRQ